jgi:hypothetical protein
MERIYKTSFKYIYQYIEFQIEIEAYHQPNREEVFAIETVKVDGNIVDPEEYFNWEYYEELARFYNRIDSEFYKDYPEFFNP